MAVKKILVLKHFDHYDDRGEHFSLPSKTDTIGYIPLADRVLSIFGKHINPTKLVAPNFDGFADDELSAKKIDELCAEATCQSDVDYSDITDNSVAIDKLKAQQAAQSRGAKTKKQQAAPDPSGSGRPAVDKNLAQKSVAPSLEVQDVLSEPQQEE